MKVNAEKYQSFCYNALLKCGVKDDAAREISSCCVMTDMMGISTHGSVNIPKYIKKMKAGGINNNVTPEVITEGPTWARLDGKGGFGMYNGRYAVDLAMKKADETGMSIVTVKNSGHFGACCAYSVYAAE